MRKIPNHQYGRRFLVKERPGRGLRAARARTVPAVPRRHSPEPRCAAARGDGGHRLRRPPGGCIPSVTAPATRRLKTVAGVRLGRVGRGRARAETDVGRRPRADAALALCWISSGGRAGVWWRARGGCSTQGVGGRAAVGLVVPSTTRVERGMGQRAWKKKTQRLARAAAAVRSQRPRHARRDVKQLQVSRAATLNASTPAFPPRHSRPLARRPVRSPVHTPLQKTLPVPRQEREQ